MGNEQTSLAVPRDPPDGMFCISLQSKRMIHLVNAPPSVAVRVQRVANEVNSLYFSFTRTPTTDKLGVIQFTMAADVFGAASGKKAATMGKLFCIKIIEELHKIGYDLHCLHLSDKRQPIASRRLQPAGPGDLEGLCHGKLSTWG